MDNCCEDHDGLTKPTTIHAEVNAIAKAAKLGHSTDGATLFVTLSPCVNCALIILQSGITAVYYSQIYKDATGLELLSASGVLTIYTGD
jgi:dCMP deaminase